MTPSPRLWIATSAALVFLIGGLSGVVVDRVWLAPEIGAGRMGPGRGMGPGAGMGMGPGRSLGPIAQNPAHVVADLDAELDLTPDQESAILKILDAWRPRVQALQAEARESFVTAQEQLHQEIAKALSEDQAKRFEAMSARLLQGGRGPGGGGPGPGPGPGGGGRRGRGGF